MFINKARHVVSSVASVPLPEGGGNSNSGDVDGQASYLHFCWAEIKGANFGVPVLMWGRKLLSGRFLDSLGAFLSLHPGGTHCWGMQQDDWRRGVSR